ncbi:MAG: SH3 domain-containing protein [Roseburia sp.]|nr:SH3 domain-containing protein [Roseburia sp.]
MKNMTLKTLGIMVLTATMLASTVTGCGDKETSEGQATEVVEAVVETEAVVPETEVVEEATEEIVVEDTETTEVEETEVQEGADYTVKDMSATKYAKQKVNVRSGASTDYEQIGSLNANQKVTVTGQADTGWYRIDYNGKEGYVSDKYLSDQKVTASTSATTTTQTVTTQNQSTGTATDTAQNQTQSVDNSGSTGDASTSAPSTSTPSADTGASTTTPDNSTSTPSTDTGSAGTGGVIDPNTGMTIPEEALDFPVFDPSTNPVDDSPTFGGIY